MTHWSLLGMDLIPPEDHDDDLEQPLEALVVVKGFDSAGNISYWFARTPGVNEMETTGMLHWALKKNEVT